MLQLLKHLRSDERGVTLLEYGALAALILVVAIAGITAVGTSVANTMTAVAAAL